MSRSDQTATDATGYDRQIREAKERAYHARRKLRRELPDPTTLTKQEAVAAAADYYDVLEDYHDERAIDGEWSEKIDTDPNRLLGKTVEVERPVECANPNATDSENVPLAATIPPDHIIRIGKQLDEIAKELGFAAVANQPTPEGEADMGDLRGLLRARGQTEALEFLPGSDEGEEDEEAAAGPGIDNGGEHR